MKKKYCANKCSHKCLKLSLAQNIFMDLMFLPNLSGDTTLMLLAMSLNKI